MKIFKILFLIAVVLFSFHPHAMAGQDENSSPAHHCVLACDTCCLSTAPTKVEMLLSSPTTVSLFFAISDSSYQNPSLDTSKRPPVASA